jgi:hypothetical protein
MFPHPEVHLSQSPKLPQQSDTKESRGNKKGQDKTNTTRNKILGVVSTYMYIE